MKTCSKHPDYKGIRPPRVRCKACEEIYKEKHKEKEVLKYDSRRRN